MKLFSLMVALIVAGLAVVGGTWAWGVQYDGAEGTPVNNGEAVLDYEVDFLYYKNGEYVSLLNQNIFDGSLWCPGRTEIVYLKVQNNEDFAVGISMDMVVTGSTFGQDLEYAVIYEDLKASTANHPESWSLFKNRVAQADLTKCATAGVLENKKTYPLWERMQLAPSNGQQVEEGGTTISASSTCYLALAIHMNESSTKQGGTASIKFDIQVDADTPPTNYPVVQ